MHSIENCVSNESTLIINHDSVANDHTCTVSVFNFEGLNFCGWREQDNFEGLYFRGRLSVKHEVKHAWHLSNVSW